jgi:hypothetical protein
VTTLTDPAGLDLGFVAWYTLAFLSLVGPLVALSAHRRSSGGVGVPPPPRRGRVAVYLGALLWLWVLLVLAWATARDTGMVLFPAWRPRPFDAVVGIVSFALGLLTLLPAASSATGLGRRRLEAVVPRTGRELVLFYVLCLCAGVGEEIVYRGVLFHLWAAVTGSWWLAALLAAAVFGAVHLYQGPRSAMIAGLYGLRDHVVVGLTGTLWVAIVVHVLHDAVLGTVIGLRVRRDKGPDDPRGDRVDALRAELGRAGISLDDGVVAEVRRHLTEPPAP